MTFCGVLSLSQVTSITLVCISPVSFGLIGLSATQQEHRSSLVGPSFQFHQSVQVRYQSKRQSVWFSRSSLLILDRLDWTRTGPRPRLSILGFWIPSRMKGIIRPNGVD